MHALASAHEPLTVYTAAPADPWHEGQRNPYREIVGMQMGEALGSRVLWLATADPTGATEEVLRLPPELANRLREFYVHHKINDPAGYNYSCHTFAALMQGELHDRHQAYEAAQRLVVAGQPASRRLHTGEWGVYGSASNGYGTALHSVVGLGPERGEVIQVDSEGGPLSIVTYDVNDAFFNKSGQVPLHTRH